MDPVLEDRFFAKVHFKPGCWEWLGAHTDGGYGQMAVGGSSRDYAHRLAYEYYVGPIPEGLQLDHLCRNRGCLNPDHLEPVTRRENILRGTSPQAIHARKTHCKHGHEFTPENTYLKPLRRGGVERVCRTCKVLRQPGENERRREKRRMRRATS